MSFVSRRKPVEAEARTAGSHHLKQTLSWPHLMALGVGAIIGTGIYTLTGVGAGLAGPGVILSFAIFKVISKLKRMLRSAKQRTIAGLQECFGKLLDHFQEPECRNYLQNSGYRYS